MSIRVISYLCPKCGAGVKFSEEDRVIKCFHCGMNFLPTHSEGIERYYFKPQIKNPQRKIESLLRKNGFNKSDYRIIDIDKLFIPVWRGSGQVTGWIAGLSPIKIIVYTEAITVPNGRQITVKRRRREGGIPLKKLMRIEKEILFNAVKFQDIRWRNEEVLNADYGKLFRVYDEKKMVIWGKIITPDVSPQTKKKEINSKFINSSVSLYNGYDPLRHRLKVIGQRIFLYYFPVILIKVKLQKKIVSLTVNGLSGKITSNTLLKKGNAPKRKKSLLLDILTILTSSILFTFLIHTNSLFLKQLGFVISIIIIVYIWIKK